MLELIFEYEIILCYDNKKYFNDNSNINKNITAIMYDFPIIFMVCNYLW